LASQQQRSRSRRFLPPDPRVTEPYRLTPQLALRIGILGTILLAAFAILFLRLWALQVLSGSQYLNAAQNNQLRLIRVPAPRGPILDRNGLVLVTNVPGSSVQIRPADLPKDPAERLVLLDRLSQVVGTPLRRIQRAVARRAGDPLTPITVKRGVEERVVYFLSERRSEFPGVEVAHTYLRHYPRKALAAHVLGHVGEATQDQLEANEAIELGDEVGQSGVEAAYDEFLRGTSGRAHLRVDSLGRPRSGIVPSQQPLPGYALRLTIDARLQQAAEAALRYGIQTAIANEAWYADGGAVVAMDPRNGQILALASNPTYRPSVFVGRTDPKKLAPLLNRRVAEEHNVPILNRAVAGQYAPGSTWKPVTALAAMEEHVLSPDEPVSCTPTYESHEQVFNNWTDAFDRAMTLPEAIETSCDTYFYQVGERFYDLGPERGHPFQAWASRFGFGVKPGLDIGPEEDGLLPTPGWRKLTFKSAEDRLWKPGDSIQLAIGQKDLQVTPLQMARFYSLIANGGKLVTPHLGLQAEQPDEDAVRATVQTRFVARAPQVVDLDPHALARLRDGLYLATHGINGTATAVFGSFPVRIAGKTGTAEKWSEEHGQMLDQSWWCGYGPTEKPELVVCVVIENGGHGGSAAAPAALKVFEHYFGERATEVTPVLTD
jgi:penicillin-binding protein 2